MDPYLDDYGWVRWDRQVVDIVEPRFLPFLEEEVVCDHCRWSARAVLWRLWNLRGSGRRRSGQQAPGWECPEQGEPDRCTATGKRATISVHEELSAGGLVVSHSSALVRGTGGSSRVSCAASDARGFPNVKTFRSASSQRLVSQFMAGPCVLECTTASCGREGWTWRGEAARPEHQRVLKSSGSAQRSDPWSPRVHGTRVTGAPGGHGKHG